MRFDLRKRSGDGIMIDRAGRPVIFQCKIGPSKIFVEGNSDASVVQRLFYRALDGGTYVLIDSNSLALGSTLEPGPEMEEVIFSESDRLAVFGDFSEVSKRYFLLRQRPTVPQLQMRSAGVLTVLMNATHANALIGDLQASYYQKAKLSKSAARRWYYRQLLLSLWPLFLAWVKQVSGLESLLRRIR